MSDSIIRTVYFASHLSHQTADALNRESGRIYSQVLVEQYRIYRKKGIWLSPGAQERYNDYLNREQPKLLHAHSVDAAQQGFPKACKTARAAQKSGFTDTRYPRKRKYYRTTVWKHTAIRRNDDDVLLSLARGLDPIRVKLPEPLREFPVEAFAEMRLVYNKASRHYEWHLVVDTGVVPEPVKNEAVAAGDLGEIHPITLTDGQESLVVSCRQLRCQSQHTAKNLASLQAKQSRHKKGSRRWWRVERRKRHFLEKQAKRRRDLEHKVSRAAVDWCVERRVATLAIGNVRDIGKGKRLRKEQQQKISNWSHGRLRRYINQKAEAAGITVVDTVDEAYTSQTCVGCGNRHKPKGRVYTCPACGSVVHRDVQGAANILSRFLYDKLARVPAVAPMYRHPVLRGKRSSPGHGASSSRKREASQF